MSNSWIHFGASLSMMVVVLFLLSAVSLMVPDVSGRTPELSPDATTLRLTDLVHPDLELWSLEARRTVTGERVCIELGSDPRGAVALIPALLGPGADRVVLLNGDGGDLPGIGNITRIDMAELGTGPEEVSMCIASTYWDAPKIAVVVPDTSTGVKAAPLAAFLGAPLLVSPTRAGVDALDLECLVLAGEQIHTYDDVPMLIELKSDDEIVRFQLELYESRGVWGEMVVIASPSDISDGVPYSLVGEIAACRSNAIVLTTASGSNATSIRDVLVSMVDGPRAMGHTLDNILIAADMHHVPSGPDASDLYYSDLYSSGNGGLSSNEKIGRIGAGSILSTSLQYGRSSRWDLLGNGTGAPGAVLIDESGNASLADDVRVALSSGLSVSDDPADVGRDTAALQVLVNASNGGILTNTTSGPLPVGDRFNYPTVCALSSIGASSDEGENICPLYLDAGASCAVWFSHPSGSEAERSFWEALMEGNSTGEAYSRAVRSIAAADAGRASVLYGDPAFIPSRMWNGDHDDAAVPMYLSAMGTFRTGSYVTVGLRTYDHRLGGFDQVIRGEFEVYVDGSYKTTSLVFQGVNQARARLPVSEGIARLDIIYRADPDVDETTHFRLWIHVEPGEPEQNTIGIVVPVIIWVLTLLTVAIYFVLSQHHKRILSQNEGAT